MLEIRYDKQKLKKLERELKAFGQRALPQVMSRSLNRTAMQARTASSRLLNKKTGIKVGDVKKRISLERASYQSWRSAIKISGRRLSLKYLAPRQTARGLSVKSSGKRVTIKTAFPALKGWFIRLPAGGGTKGTLDVSKALEIDAMQKVARLPIGRIRGPILSEVYAKADSETARIYAESLNKLEKNIHDQVQLILKKRVPA